MSANNQNPRYSGFSIVEYLIAIFLGTLIILGVINIYFSNKTSFNIQEGLSRLQENGRYSTHFMNNSIRMAGYFGCASVTQSTIINLLTTPATEIDINNTLLGYEGSSGTWSPALPAHLSGLGIEAGTDVIEIRKGSNTSSQLTTDMANSDSAVLINSRADIDSSDIVVVTDCEDSTLFQATASGGGTSLSALGSGNTSSSLAKAYKTDAQAMKFEYMAFYIKDTGRTNNSGQPIYALFSVDLSGEESEVAEGVDDLQLEYGIDADNDNNVDAYQTADTVNGANNWANVMTVKVNKLITTVNDVNPSPQSFNFNGTTVTPTDRVLRRSWNNVINLRNRSTP